MEGLGHDQQMDQRIMLTLYIIALFTYAYIRVLIKRYV